MILKGNLHQSASGLADYMLAKGDNEQVVIVANSGTIFSDLTPDSLRLAAQAVEMQMAGTKAKHQCYHKQISPGKAQSLTMTHSMILETIQTTLEQCGLDDGRVYFATIHKKPDGMHIHLAVSRSSPLTGKVDKNKLWRDDHNRVRSMLEDRFNHPRTPMENPRRKDIKQQLTGLYGGARTPQMFIEGVNRLGYAIAYGGSTRSHPWQLVDGFAVGHNLNSLITQPVEGKDKKLTTKQLIDYFRGIRFPDLKQAIKLQRGKKEIFDADMNRAEREARQAEQFHYSPDSRPGKKEQTKSEVGNDPLGKKQDAALAAISHFKEKKRFKEKFAAFSENQEMTENQKKEIDQQRKIEEIGQEFDRIMQNRKLKL